MNNCVQCLSHNFLLRAFIRRTMTSVCILFSAAKGLFAHCCNGFGVELSVFVRTTWPLLGN